MPQFSYTVISKDNRQLAGTIEAQDEQAARQELNALGFSVLSLVQGALTEPTEQQNAELIEDIKKFEFSAYDKNAKKIVGTIQGKDIYEVFRRLIYEFQFDVQSLYPENLSAGDKEKAELKGIDYLKDRLLEEEMAAKVAQEKQAMDEKEFQERQAMLKGQVDFVLQKVNSTLDTYRDELDPPRKAKIKYFVEKILRIKNSTNLDYIRGTCEELLTYLQKEELFLNEQSKLKEKTQLTIEAKSMMMELSRIAKPQQKDLFDDLREWRKEHIIENNNPGLFETTINLLITPLIGPAQEDPEIITAREKLKSSKGQFNQFLRLYFQSSEPEYKKEIQSTLKRLWGEIKIDKTNLKKIIEQKHHERLANIEYTSTETLAKEIFGVAGWVLTFYIIYYFATIYLNSKQIDFIPETKLNNLFQTSIIKYFFTTLFLMVCFLGIKIEFFRRKPAATPILFFVFLISSSLIILNF
ncbi:hypothetical protein IT411_01425 [Candidatus Peregrinibacteria bacterium]|nr:hypothetical protein [Candidatus Peregrinibacteria bacterium]